MLKISDNKALYLQDISINEYPANTQRIIRSSIEYFCRWADATTDKGSILSVEYLESLLSQYHSHLISLNTAASNLRSKLKYAKLFVLWLQSALSTKGSGYSLPLLNPPVTHNDRFRTNKYPFYALVFLAACILLYIFYLIVLSILSPLSLRDKYYVINSTKSINIQLNPSSSVLYSNSLNSSSFVFKFIRDTRNTSTLIIYCPVSYLSMEPKINIISVPLSSCTSKDKDVSNELIDFSGYVDVFVDTQFIARRVLN